MTTEPTLWGVELEDGTITRCPVSECIYEERHICWRAGGHTGGNTPREAVVRWAARMGLAVESILAPGVPSRAELVAERGLPRPSVWFVSWRITQDGSKAQGVVGCFFNERTANVAALHSINFNWVQGEWGDYSNIFDEFKKLIAKGAYVEAVQLWAAESGSYYEVDVTEVAPEVGVGAVDIEEMGFDTE